MEKRLTPNPGQRLYREEDDTMFYFGLMLFIIILFVALFIISNSYRYTNSDTLRNEPVPVYHVIIYE